MVVICEGNGKTHILTHSSINTTQTQEAHKRFEEAKVRETLKKTKSTNSRSRKAEEEDEEEEEEKGEEEEEGK